MTNKISMAQAVNGVKAYVREEIMPNLPSDGWGGFSAGFVSTIALSKVENILRNMLAHPVVAMLDVVDADGLIDIDTIYQAAEQAMPDKGVTLEFLGQRMTFKGNDLRRLYGLITQD